MTPSRRTIYIVDDNAAFRSSAQWWLESAGYDVREFEDPSAALAALAPLAAAPGGRADPAGCLLLDVRMPGMSGLELHQRLRGAGLAWPVIYMTGHGDVPLAVQAMQQGAVSFLEKPFADAALEAALARAFEPGAARPEADDEAAHEWRSRRASLTPRETEVLQWVLDEKLNKQIASLMNISIKTVELHRARMMDKLGASSVRHLMKMAVAERVTR